MLAFLPKYCPLFSDKLHSLLQSCLLIQKQQFHISDFLSILVLRCAQTFYQNSSYMWNWVNNIEGIQQKHTFVMWCEIYIVNAPIWLTCSFRIFKPTGIESKLSYDCANFSYPKLLISVRQDKIKKSKFLSDLSSFYCKKSQLIRLFVIKYYFKNIQVKI